jgi:hypothetical protein
VAHVDEDVAPCAAAWTALQVALGEYTLMMLLVYLAKTAAASSA